MNLPHVTVSSDWTCTHSLYDLFYSAKDKKAKGNNRTLSAAGSWEKRGRREERKRKKKGETSKEEEDMMEQARGRGNQTPHTHTHTQRLHVTHMSERRANPCWRLITLCHSQREFGDFSLLSHSADTHLCPGDVRLGGCSAPKKPARSFHDDCGANAPASI